MKAKHLKYSYSITEPTVWRGTYTCNNAYWNENWTWYKDGRPNTVNVPHVTIAFGLNHEVAQNGDWVGFHVSFPLDGGGKNARFNYGITRDGRVTYKNTSRAGLRAELQTEVDSLSTLWATFDAFAVAFHRAAMQG